MKHSMELHWILLEQGFPFSVVFVIQKHTCKGKDGHNHTKITRATGNVVWFIWDLAAVLARWVRLRLIFDLLIFQVTFVQIYHLTISGDWHKNKRQRVTWSGWDEVRSCQGRGISETIWQMILDEMMSHVLSEKIIFVLNFKAVSDQDHPSPDRSPLTVLGSQDHH